MDRNPERAEPDANRSFSNFLPRGAEVGATRRFLPHWQFDGGLYFVTWRLADSLPRALLRKWAEDRRIWLKQHPQPWSPETREAYQREFPRRIEDWLDAGYGACVLCDSACSEIMARVMLRFDGDRYDMASFVIMPNHVHALFQLRGATKLHALLKAWKGTSAREINSQLGQHGTLWMDESRDTSIRNPDHLARCYGYILDNPAKANLAPGTFLYYESPGITRQMGELNGEPE